MKKIFILTTVSFFGALVLSAMCYAEQNTTDDREIKLGGKGPLAETLRSAAIDFAGGKEFNDGKQRFVTYYGDGKGTVCPYGFEKVLEHSFKTCGDVIYGCDTIETFANNFNNGLYKRVDDALPEKAWDTYK
ncbi:MAG: hypothetical protein V1647_01490 [Pseudomonadota bacterium]